MRIIAACAVTSACAVASWVEPEPVETSHVATFRLPSGGPAQVDLLIAIDDTAPIAAYRERIVGLAAEIERAIDPRIDLRVAVAFNDGELRGSTPFLTQRLEFDLSRTANFRGPLSEALLPRLELGSANAAASRPLAAIRSVVDRNIDAFVRESSLLSVLLITASDDAPAEEVERFAQWWRNVKAWRHASLGVIHASATSTLDALAYPGAIASIDSDDDGPVLERLSAVFFILLGICFEIPDIDPVFPGDQFDCAISAQISGRERLLRPCAGDADPDPLCWRLVPSDHGCRNPRAVRPEFAAYRFWWFNPELHIECVTPYPDDDDDPGPLPDSIVNTGSIRRSETGAYFVPTPKVEPARDTRTLDDLAPQPHTGAVL